jgi:tRNA1Val (adenine37-N6)-methyltransferase
MQVSEDRFLGGRFVARQPLHGFRAGTDAVMLAAAVPAQAGEELLELGSGAGIASLAVAVRVPGCGIIGAELALELVRLAGENARTNAMERRVRFDEADALNLPEPLRRSFDHVFLNPPFHETGQISPSEERALAREDAGRLGDWFSAGLKRVRAGGTLTAILRADRLAEALKKLPQQGVVILPLWPRSGEAAKRVIVQVRKNSHAASALLAGIILHEADGSYTREADAVLRGGDPLALASPRL